MSVNPLENNPDEPYGLRVARSLPKGATVYVIIRSVSRDGMSRVMDLHTIQAGTDDARGEVFTDLVSLREAAIACGWSRANNGEGVRVRGTGMNMAEHLVGTIARRLHDDERRWTVRVI